MSETYNAHEPIPLEDIHGWHDLTRMAKRAGSHFFDDDTLKFFGSRLLGAPRLVSRSDDRLRAVYVGVTSEYDGFDRRGREYRVRVFRFSSHTAIRDDGRTLDLIDLVIDDADNGEAGFGVRYSTSRTANNVARFFTES